MFKQFVAGMMLAVAGQASAYTVANGKVLDDQGQRVQIRGVNWFGMETNDGTVHGLWARNWRDMITQMQGLDINAVRLPFCAKVLQNFTPRYINYAVNPDLQGLGSLQILDKLVQEFSDRGMYVLLDHHASTCGVISELWYTSTYSEAQWIADLSAVAQRYANVPGVIGIDLKNEPYGRATWGTGNVATDWNLAAERAAAAILPKAPNWLIFVEGIADTSHCSSNIGHFWGGNLEPFACAPLNIPADKLVLTPHVYGPDVYAQSYFSDPAFPANMPAIWETHFGFVRTQGYAVVPGEFGGKYGTGDPRDVLWQNALVDWFISKDMSSGFYWSWNPNSTDTGGILKDDWTSVRTDKMELLHRLWRTAAPMPPAPESEPAESAPPVPPTVEAFQFVDRSEAPANRWMRSNLITLSGFEGSVALSIDFEGQTGAVQVQYRINGGEWLDAAVGREGLVAGDTVELRSQLALQPGDTARIRMMAGATGDDWDLTVGPADGNPHAFGFADVTGAAPSSKVKSGWVKPKGYDQPLPISVTGGEYRVKTNGIAGEWTSVPGTLWPMDWVELRLKTSSKAATTRSMDLQVGPDAVRWSVTTAP